MSVVALQMIVSAHRSSKSCDKIIKMKSILVLLFSLLTYAASETDDTVIGDHYWKDYTGGIPVDAVPGGKNTKGEITYIGRTALDADFVVNGEIDPATKTLSYVASGAAHTTQENIKILCTHTPGAHQWVKYTNDRPLLTQVYLLMGGFVNHLPYFIGRRNTNGRIVIGEVLVNVNDWHNWFVYIENGKDRYENIDFEVLLLNRKSCIDNEDYYWRDYTGGIPVDAVPGGKNTKGEITYIRHTNHNGLANNVFNGEIDPATKTLSYTNEVRTYTIQEDIKILCTHSPEVYQWVNYTTLDVPFLTQINLVLGGSYRHLPHFIGRREINGRIVIGLVCILGDRHNWFIYLENGKVRYEDRDFQVLLLNRKPCNKVQFKDDCPKCGPKAVTINFYANDEL